MVIIELNNGVLFFHFAGVDDVVVRLKRCAWHRRTGF